MVGALVEVVPDGCAATVFAKAEGAGFGVVKSPPAAGAVGFPPDGLAPPNKLPVAGAATGFVPPGFAALAPKREGYVVPAAGLVNSPPLVPLAAGAELPKRLVPVPVPAPEPGVDP